MAIGYARRSPPADPALLDRLEQQIGRPLPAAYRAHLGAQDGGRFEDNDRALKQVFGVAEDLPSYQNIWAKLRTYEGRVPAWLLPFASDEYGNLFALSLRDDDHGAVWFWDHEGEDDESEPPSEENLTQVAPDLPGFLAALAPPSNDE